MLRDSIPKVTNTPSIPTTTTNTTPPPCPTTLLPSTLQSNSEPKSTLNSSLTPKFTFTPQPPPSSSSSMTNKVVNFPNSIEKIYPEVNLNLNKWGFNDHHMSVHRFTFDHHLSSDYLVLPFLQQFFTSAEVLQTFKVLFSETNAWTSLGQVDPSSLVVDQLSTEYSDLSLFNCLFEKGILREDGSIKPCFDTQVSCTPDCLGTLNLICTDPLADLSSFDTPFLVSDELKVCLLDPTSESLGYFPKDTLRKEALFHILFHLVMGGHINQFDENIGPYFDAVKAFSRTFLRVVKKNESSISIRSLVFRVLNLNSSLAPLFPSLHPQNFLLLFVDPIGRQVMTWYHAAPSYYL